MEIRADSTEYIYSSVVSDADPTGKVIEVSFPVVDAVPSAWHTASTVEIRRVVTEPERWKATFRLLVGPAEDVVLTPGLYDFTVRFNDTPEFPVRRAGTVRVTEV